MNKNVVRDYLMDKVPHIVLDSDDQHEEHHFTKKHIGQQLRDWIELHKDTVTEEKIKTKARYPDWWVDQIKYPVSVPEPQEWIVYVGYFPETYTLKIGRTEDWGPRANNYMYMQSSTKRGSGLMILRDYVYVTRHGDRVVDEYLYRCSEKLLKNLADQFPFFKNLYGESGRVLEYYDVLDETKISDFIDIVRMTFDGITAQELRQVQKPYKEREFANTQTKDGQMAYKAEEFSKLLDQLE